MTKLILIVKAGNVILHVRFEIFAYFKEEQTEINDNLSFLLVKI